MKNMKLALGSIVLLAAAQNVLAHTGFKDVVQEGVTTYNAVNGGHGCASNEIPEGGSAAQKDLIAMAVLFPNSPDPTASVVTKTDPVTGAVIETIADLSNDIKGVAAGVGFANLGFGHVQPNLFPNYVPKTVLKADGAKLSRGFFVHNGPKPYASAPIWESVVSSSALAPFRVGPISFNTASCAVSLKVRAAIVNYCKSGKINNTAPDRADVWIGHMTTKYNDPLVMPYNQADTAAGKVFWPTMTIARNLTTNPLPAGCGAGYNVVIEPTDADIDANLPVPFGLAPAAAPQRYWPSAN